MRSTFRPPCCMLTRCLEPTAAHGVRPIRGRCNTNKKRATQQTAGQHACASHCGPALSLPIHSPLLYTTTARCAASLTEHGTYISILQRRWFPDTNRASQNVADDVSESKGQARRCSQRPGISIDRQDQCCGIVVRTRAHQSRHQHRNMSADSAELCYQAPPTTRPHCCVEEKGP